MPCAGRGHQFLPSSNALPHGVRTVVTLDADTRLPRDAVRRLVGKMVLDRVARHQKLVRVKI